MANSNPFDSVTDPVRFLDYAFRNYTFPDPNSPYANKFPMTDFRFAIPGYESFSDTAKNLLQETFSGESIAGQGYEKTTEYTWETLCLRFNLPKYGNKEKELELLSEAYFTLWDIEADCFIVEC